MEQGEAIALVIKERERQDQLFGKMPRGLQPALWALLLTEEAIEVGEAVYVGSDSQVTDMLSEMTWLRTRIRELLERRGMKGEGSGGKLSPICEISDFANYRDELIQVAAVAIAALEDLS